ncbi:MAG: ArsR/SmtB family transcription factor [Thermoproteota archaeon]
MELIDVLGNPTRLKILCVLANHGPSTRYRIWKETGAAQRSISQQLNLLIDIGLVRRLNYESVILYELKESNPAVVELKQILDLIWSKRNIKL